jgi:hypothetical protein
MKPTYIFLLVVALCVAGCDTMNYQQYQIAGVAAGSPDAARIKSVLQTVASQTGLDDRISASRVTNTLAFYSQPPQAFRVDLGARFYQTNVLVDLVGGFGPTPPAYKLVKRLLTPALTNEFGSRLSIPQPFVPIQ